MAAALPPAEVIKPTAELATLVKMAALEKAAMREYQAPVALVVEEGEEVVGMEEVALGLIKQVNNIFNLSWLFAPSCICKVHLH